eukprot:781993-Karenia_brevis.AAC.1
MNAINAQGNETTINTTKRFLESRVQDTSLGEADELKAICLWKSKEEMETESTGSESVHKQHLDKE